MAEKHAYSQAAGTGKYERVSGLLGKYDNARRFWEDQVTGIFLRPALNELVERKSKNLERVRVADLGCGSGDGFDLLMGITSKDAGIYDYITAAITQEVLQEYLGLDINQDLLDQAREVHGSNPKVHFEAGDLSQGLPQAVTGRDPFDVYFSSYGTFSHLHDAEAARLLADIGRHAKSGSLVVGDWLGRYSVEWQDLWHHPPDEEYFMDYRISYIYPEEERDKVDVAGFDLRLMTREEIEAIVKEAEAQSGVQLRPLGFMDRSLLVGRHLETGDYNANCPRLRTPINSLFESYTRTDLGSLLVDYVPRQGFGHLNNFFEMFYMSTNALVTYTIDLLAAYDAEERRFTNEPLVMPYYPPALKEAMDTMHRVIEGVGWVKFGDVRANVIEPHLGYSLRKLEMDFQPGTGMGHSLLAAWEVVK